MAGRVDPIVCNPPHASVRDEARSIAKGQAKISLLGGWKAQQNKSRTKFGLGAKYAF